VLSGKPLLAVLHQESTAVNVITDSKAGIVLAFNGEEGLNHIKNSFADKFKTYLNLLQHFDRTQVNMKIFEQYSAKSVTQQLVNLVNKALNNN
jgi:hypothetical protein